LFGAQLLLYFEAVARIGAQQAVVLLHVYPMLVVFGERWARELPPFAVSGLVFLPGGLRTRSVGLGAVASEQLDQAQVADDSERRIDHNSPGDEQEG
jgi:hypothetical protein